MGTQIDRIDISKRSNGMKEGNDIYKTTNYNGRKFKYHAYYSNKLNGYILEINDKDIGLKFGNRQQVRHFIKNEIKDIKNNSQNINLFKRLGGK